ncbi:MAG: menaquinone biosynthesis protein [Planctomycetota bacterium]
MHESPQSLRVGGVTYLNSKPLVDALPALLPNADLSFDLPSRLADRLAKGRLDAALVPAAELANHPDWSVVSDACIACRGPVLSVRLLFRVPPAEVRTLALDEGSRTSRVLAQILLHDIYGVRPELTSLPIGMGPEETDTDAVLLIGDRAMKPSPAVFVESWDLGDRWCRWTELPFVFAVWAARSGVAPERLLAGFSCARDLGVARVERIAREQAERMGLEPELVLEYLTKNLHFTLGPRERQGLELYFRRAAELGLMPTIEEPTFHGCPV